MASKQVKDELKLGYTLASGGRELINEIARRRAIQFEARGLAKRDVESTIRAGILLELGSLEYCSNALLVADDALDAAEGRSPATIARRDAAAEVCLKALVATREVIVSVCDESAERNLGFSGTTLRDPESVEKLAGRVAARLESDPPKVVLAGITLDLAALIGALRRDQAELVAANEAARSVKHAIGLTRAHRDEAWATYTAERTQVGARLDASLRVVGLGDAAEGLFPTRAKTPHEARGTEEVKRDEASAPTADAKPSHAARKPKRAEKAEAKENAPPAKPAETAKPVEVAKPADAAKPALMDVIPAVNTRPSMPAPPS